MKNLQRILWVLGTLWIVMFPSVVQGSIYYVSKDGNPVGPGTTWETAFDHFTTALAFAQSDDSIFISEGIYVLPDSERLFILYGVSMFGGFGGWESTLADRIPEMHETIIKSLGNYSKIVLDSINVPSVLNRLTFTDGNSYDYPFGNDPCFYTTTECPGGILYIASTKGNEWREIVISECTFSGNRAHFGGAIGIVNYGESRSKFKIIKCTFENNYAFELGGAIFINSESSSNTMVVEIDSCLFKKNYNSSSGGGGLYIETRGGFNNSIIIRNSVFDQNTAGSVGGGGIYINNLGENILEDLIIKRCEFLNNKHFWSSAGWVGGSAIRLIKGGYVTECIFKNNRSTRSSVLAGYHMHVSNSLFVNNYSGGDASILSMGESEWQGDKVFRNVFSNCTFVNNRADIHIPLFRRSYPPCKDTIVNCIFWNNSNAKDSVVYTSKWNDIETGNKLFVSNIGGDVSHTSFYFAEEDGDTNFDTDVSTWVTGDPHFVDTLAGDFRLKRCSPYINKGNNKFVNSPIDYANNVRIQEGIVEIGAFEIVKFAPVVDWHNNTCAHSPNGEIVVSSGGSTPPANWTITDQVGEQWENGQLNEGSYIAVLKDGEECEEEFQFELEGPDTIQAWFTVNGAAQWMPAGLIRIDSIKGGQPPYLIQWFNGGTSNLMSKLYAGHYTVNIIDSFGCKRLWEIEVPLITGITDPNQNRVFKINNPSYGYIQYRWDEMGATTPCPFVLLNAVGVIVKSGFIQQGTQYIDVEELPSGYYGLQVFFSGNQTTYPVLLISR